MSDVTDVLSRNMPVKVSLGSSADLISQIGSRSARIGIIGLGYVGLPLALLFSEEKFRVTGFDIDARKVSSLAEGGSYIARIPPTEIQSAREHGFSATSDYTHISEMDAVINLCSHAA